MTRKETVTDAFPKNGGFSVDVKHFRIWQAKCAIREGASLARSRYKITFTEYEQKIREMKKELLEKSRELERATARLARMEAECVPRKELDAARTLIAELRRRLARYEGPHAPLSGREIGRKEAHLLGSKVLCGRLFNGVATAPGAGHLVSWIQHIVEKPSTNVGRSYYYRAIVR